MFQLAADDDVQELFVGGVAGRHLGFLPSRG
jgi:hypothetical protein